MHTDPSLKILSQVTTSLGKCVRKFIEKTCSAFQTRELERERAARQRRQDRNAANRREQSNPAARPRTTASTRISKGLNLKRYTYHSLGDYVSSIQHFGTIDSYSTQPVSDPCIYLNTLLTTAGRFFRVNWSTEHPKRAIRAQVGEMYRCRYQRSSADNA